MTVMPSLWWQPRTSGAELSQSLLHGEESWRQLGHLRCVTWHCIVSLACFFSPSCLYPVTQTGGVITEKSALFLPSKINSFINPAAAGSHLAKPVYGQTPRVYSKYKMYTCLCSSFHLFVLYTKRCQCWWYPWHYWRESGEERGDQWFHAAFTCVIPTIQALQSVVHPNTSIPLSFTTSTTHPIYCPKFEVHFFKSLIF